MDREGTRILRSLRGQPAFPLGSRMVPDCWAQGPGGRLQPVLMRHPPQLSVKTCGGGGVQPGVGGGGAGGCRIQGPGPAAPPPPPGPKAAPPCTGGMSSLSGLAGTSGVNLTLSIGFKAFLCRLTRNFRVVIKAVAFTNCVLSKGKELCVCGG